MTASADGKYKPESFKHFHIEHLIKYCREFIELLDSVFAKDWVEKTPPNQDPFRRLYVHGWPFAVKAIAAAYHRSRIDELGPLAAALGARRDAGKTFAEASHLAESGRVLDDGNGQRVAPGNPVGARWRAQRSRENPATVSRAADRGGLEASEPVSAKEWSPKPPSRPI